MSRAAVRADLKVQLASALTDVGVFVGAANNDVPHEGVWLWDPEDSDIEYSAMAGANTAVRDDIYRFEVRAVAGKPGQTATDAEKRVNTIMDTVEASIIAQRHIAADPAVISVLPVSLRGPVTGPTTEGVISAMYLTVEVHERKGP